MSPEKGELLLECWKKYTLRNFLVIGCPVKQMSVAWWAPMRGCIQKSLSKICLRCLKEVGLGFWVRAQGKKKKQIQKAWSKKKQQHWWNIYEKNKDRVLLSNSVRRFQNRKNNTSSLREGTFISLFSLDTKVGSAWCLVPRRFWINAVTSRLLVISNFLCSPMDYSRQKFCPPSPVPLQDWKASPSSALSNGCKVTFSL